MIHKTLHKKNPERFSNTKPIKNHEVSSSCPTSDRDRFTVKRHCFWCCSMFLYGSFVFCYLFCLSLCLVPTMLPVSVVRPFLTRCQCLLFVHSRPPRFSLMFIGYYLHIHVLTSTKSAKFWTSNFSNS